MFCKNPRAILLFALAAQLSRSDVLFSQQGAFHIEDVWYIGNRSEFVGETKVFVFANAVYRGKPRSVEHFWIIQTMLNNSLQHGEKKKDLSDFEDPDAWGEGKTGTWIPQNGERYTCGLGCAVEARVPLCMSDDSPVSYLGRAAIAFYGDPADEGRPKLGQIEKTKCRYSVGGAVIGLKGAASVTLSNNGVDFITADGKGGSGFVFPKSLHDGDEYKIEVSQQPQDGLRCSVDPSTAEGRIDREDVTDVRINCTYTCRATKSIVSAPGDFEAAGATHCSPPQLVNRGDGTVADLANNLLWTEDFVDNVGGAQEKYRACGELVLGGRTDWAVPDIAQLQTLLPDCQGQMYNCVGTIKFQTQI